MRILKAFVFGGLGLVVLGVAAFFVLGFTSQNGSAPGLAEGRLSPCPDSPNCVSSEEGTVPEKLAQPLSPGAWGKLAQVIEAEGGTVISASDDYISAEFKSAIFGFVDDVEFRRDETQVHVRSASRVGYSDAGANAARVSQIRGTLGK